jgi:hypothetical protein
LLRNACHDGRTLTQQRRLERTTELRETREALAQIAQIWGFYQVLTNDAVGSSNMSGSQEKQRPKETDTPQSSANFGRITVDCKKLLQLQNAHPRNPASKPKFFQTLKSKNIQGVQQEKKWKYSYDNCV